MKFSELQQQVKEEFGIDHLADIARELGVSPQAVSNWKARDRVPYKYVIKVRKRLIESRNQGEYFNENLNTDTSQHLFKNPYSNFDKRDTGSILNILLTMAKHLKIIIIIPTIFCIVTIFYVQFIAQPVFISRAKIMSSRAGGGVYSDVLSQFGFNIATNQPEAQWVYTEIIKSRTLARAVLKRKFDTILYGKQKSLLQILTNSNKDSDFDESALEILSVDLLIEMIEMDEDLTSRIITLDISAPEPQFAADIATAVIDELDTHQREYNSAKISETRRFIEERIVDTEIELSSAEETLKIFNDQNRRIENSPSLQLERNRLSREVGVLTSVFTTLKQQLETAKIEEVKESDYVVVLDPPEVPLYRSKPKKKRMTFLAGLLGISIGIVLTFVKDFMEKTGEEGQENVQTIKALVVNNIKELILIKKRRIN